MLTPYKGTLQYATKVDKIVSNLNTAIINIGKPLNYEVKEYKYPVDIITGFYPEEKSVPPFEHPIIFKDVKGNTRLAIDLRPFLKSNLDNMVNVIDYLADRYNGMLQLRRLIFTNLMLNEDYSFLPPMRDKLQTIFSNSLASLYTVMLYDKTVYDVVNVVSQIHFITMDSTITDVKNTFDYLDKVTLKRLLTGDLKPLYEKLLSVNLTLPSKTITDLINNINAVSDNERVKGVNEDVLIGSLSRTFYSFDSKELSVAFIEHLPTTIAIIYAVIKESINNRSPIRKLIEARKSKLKPKDLIKTIDTIVEENLEKV